MKFTHEEFNRLLNESKYQFNVKTNDSIYFITPKGYESYNQFGFVAHNESNGKIDILSYKDVIQVTIDSKKFNYD